MDAAQPFPPSLPDAGTPPSYCVPSCLWDAIRACTPPHAALCQTSGSEFNRLAVCDSKTGWAELEVSGGQQGTRRIISQGGVACLTVAWGGASPVPGYIYFGEGTSGAYLSSDRTEARCELNAPVIALEPQRPECAPWTGPDAGLLFPTLRCDTIVAGQCETGL